jgi:hypothetical protein
MAPAQAYAGGMPKAARIDDCQQLEDLPNIGPAMAGDLRRLGIRAPSELAGRDPLALYQALCRATGTRQDPCVLDTFIAAVRFAEGGPALPWWRLTAERKHRFPDL